MPSQSPFRIDLLNATGVRVSDGPLTDILSLDTTEKLDEIGDLSFSLPAGSIRAGAILPSSQFDVYDEQDGYLGRYVFKNDRLRESQGRATLTVTAYDSLVKLSRRTVGFRRAYTYHPVEQVVADLLSIAGWEREIDPNIGNTTVAFEGESILRGVDEMRDRFQVHFRLKRNTVQTLQFGSFGFNTGILLTRFEGQFTTTLAARDNRVIVESISRARDRDGVVNRIIALGAGQGSAQLTMAGATAGTYVLKTGTNPDGSTYYYIEDTTSIAQYDVVERVLVFGNIRPISNSASAIALAANALKLSAEAYLQKHLVERIQYDVVVRKIPPNLQPGDKIRLQYRGVTQDTTYIDVNQDFYVLDITRSRNINGDRRATLRLSSDLARRTTDTDTITETIHDAKAVRLQVQPGVFRHHGVIRDWMEFHSIYEKKASFPIWIDNSVTHLIRVLVRFKTLPVEAVAHYFSTNTFGYWDWVRDEQPPYGTPNYPGFIRLWVNGVDRSVQFGGPWNTQANRGTQVIVEADITQFLTPIHQEHTVEISCEPAQEFSLRQVAYNGLSVYQVAYEIGQAEIQVSVLGVCQAIAPT